MSVLFGPSGVGDDGVKNGITVFKIPEYIKNKGLDAFEYSFGHGYNMSLKTAIVAGLKFKQHDIKLSIHCPFYINFANPEEEMYQKSENYLTTGMKYMRAMGGDKMVFHAGSCGRLSREEALRLMDKRFREMFDKFESQNLLDGIYLCPETMGKSMQIGTYKEIINLCTINPHLVPTFDFGHINALNQGSLKTADDYKQIWDYCIEKLGRERANNSHIHFSKVQFGAKGEIKHLNYTEDNIYGPSFEPLAQTLIDYDLSPRVICESMSDMVKDSQIMKETYKEIYSNLKK